MEPVRYELSSSTHITRPGNKSQSPHLRMSRVQATSPGQRLTSEIGCSVCNSAVNELGPFAAGVLAVVDVKVSRGAVMPMVVSRVINHVHFGQARSIPAGVLIGVA